MKKTPVIAALALGTTLALYLMFKGSSVPNIPSEERMEPAEETLDSGMQQNGPQEGFSPSGAERVEAIEEAPESSAGGDSTSGSPLPPEAVEPINEAQEEKPDSVPVSDINLTEELSADNRIQKVAEIRSVRCEDKSCVISTQVKPGEEEEVQMAFILFQKDHLQYGSGFKVDIDKDDPRSVTFTFSQE